MLAPSHVHVQSPSAYRAPLYVWGLHSVVKSPLHAGKAGCADIIWQYPGPATEHTASGTP